jgi:hypothetical protein
MWGFLANRRKMRFGIILVYSDVFPEERQLPSMQSILGNTSTAVLIEVLCYLNCILHTKQFSAEKQLELCQKLLFRQPKSNTSVVSRSLAIMKMKGHPFHVFDSYTLMKTINFALENKNNKKQDDSTVEDEWQIFKAVLLANEKLNEDFRNDITGETDLLMRFAKLTWPNLISSVTHRQRNEFLLWIYKCIKFLDFISTNKELSIYFCDYFKIKDPSDLTIFVKEIVQFYVSVGMNKTHGHFNYRMSYKLDVVQPVLSPYCMELETLKPSEYMSKDFKSLRQFPIIKLNDDRFVVTNWNFILEKLGVGLVFDLFNNTELKNKYRDFSDFKSKMGLNIWEKEFQEIMKDSVLKKGDIYSIGETNAKNNCDFYIRRNSQLSVIEFKDTLIPKETRYDEIKADIDRKFTGTKGIGQIKKILDKLKDDINVLEPKNSSYTKNRKPVIYPVIVVTEALYTLSGINTYLNREFKKIIMKEDYPFYVKPLMILPFDYFLLANSNFKTGKVDYFKFLEKYNVNLINARRRAFRSNKIEVKFKMFDGFIDSLDNIIPKTVNKSDLKKENTLVGSAIKKIKLEKK